jgi:hypothetical protein
VRLGAVLLFATVCVFAASASVAAAASVTASPSAMGTVPAAPAVTGAVQVQLLLGSEPDSVVAILNVTLPAGTKLPALVRIPLPEKSQIIWAGEVLGGDVNQDPSRAYRVVPGQGGDVLEMVLQQTGTAQVEAVVAKLAKAGGKVSATVPWVQSATAQSTEFSVRFPPATANHTTDPKWTGTPERNNSGETLYVLPDAKLAVGQKYPIKASYSVNADLPQPNPTGTSNLTVFLLAGALLIAIVALIGAIQAQRNRSAE